MTKVTKIFTEKEEESKKLKVAAYCRVSTNSDEQMESLDAQKKHYQKYETLEQLQYELSTLKKLSK